MSIESWMISVVIALVGVISTFAVYKNKVSDSEDRDKKQDDRLEKLEKFMNSNTPLLEHLSKSENAIFAKLDKHSSGITTLQQQIGQSPTMKEVRDEFMTKEMFRQVEKHIDNRFDTFEKKFDGLNEGLEKILAAVKE